MPDNNITSVFNDMPESLKRFVEIESEENFQEDRYFVPEKQKQLINRIMQMKHTASEMHKLHLPFLNSTILSGTPGNGKTTFARYIAYIMQEPLVFINFARLASSNAGEAAQRLHEIFRYVAPKHCVFLLDEIDCIAVNRADEKQDTSSESYKTTITLMQEMDYFKKVDANATILAATNRVDRLDSAFISRFAISFTMPNLTNDQKIAYMQKFLNSVGVEYDISNLKSYVLEYAALHQREIESDMVMSIANWLTNHKTSAFLVTHVDTKKEF